MYTILLNVCLIIVPSAIDGLILNDYDPYSLGISWNPPIAPNGIITVYEIRYRNSILVHTI